jgi:purine-binding chemotaxis protein CheW
MHIDTPTACSPKTEYLSFTVGGLEYGLDFRKVQELRVLKSLERFASDGEIISGVAVSRGVIMPIVDMRAAFCGRPVVPGPNTDVIILKLSSCVMGMVVDGVTDVVTLHSDQVSPIPMADGGEPADYLIGLGQVDGRRLILIDIDRLMSIERRAPASASQAA